MKGPQFLKEDKSKWPKVPNTFDAKEAYDEVVKISPRVTHALTIEAYLKIKLLNLTG